jgi:hypothetical protein
MSLGPNLGPHPVILGDNLRQAESEKSIEPRNKTPGKTETLCVSPGDSSKLPRQDSNLNKENQNLFAGSPNPNPGNTCVESGRAVDRALTIPIPELPVIDPDLARLIEAWPTLLDPIRRAMLALLSSATDLRVSDNQ